MLERKIHNFYGPLSFLLICTQSYLENSKNILQHYGEYFLPNKFSQSPDVQYKVRAQSEATIELSNDYFRKVIDNNQNIFNLISKNYSLIDSEEDERFINDFVRMFIRLDAEYINPRITMNEIPFEIQERRGELGTIANTFILQIIKKNKSLNDQLKKLVRQST